MGFIDFGGWASYYYFLIGSIRTKVLKKDILLVSGNLFKY